MQATKEMSLTDLGEFGLIGRIRERFPAPEGVTGIGDDCAVIPQRSGRDTLVSTDMLVEGTHFLRDRVSPYQLGWKSAAVNLSDIAAMGGQPTATFLSVALPPDLEADWMGEFLLDHWKYRSVYPISCVLLHQSDLLRALFQKRSSYHRASQ